MFITLFESLKAFGFREESYHVDQSTFMCNFFHNEVEGFVGLESAQIKNKSVLFDEFLNLGMAIKFSHQWKYLKCSSKFKSNLILKAVNFVFDSRAPTFRELEFEWHLLCTDRWTTKIDVMNFDFDSQFILLNYYPRENFIALTTKSKFIKKMHEVKKRPITINDFSKEDITAFRLTVFNRPQLISIEKKPAYGLEHISRP
jgi:hypothetical protein